MDVRVLIFLIPLGVLLLWILFVNIGELFHKNENASVKKGAKHTYLLSDDNLFDVQEMTSLPMLPKDILDFSITKEWLQEISSKSNRENRWHGFKTDHEKYPTYHLSSFSFDKNTRKCTLEIKKRTEYRTILRYQQVNYTRYAIYSNEWKAKETTIRKSIKLTNEVLENLTFHEDELVSDFAHLIILYINDSTLYPSWFLRELYDLMIEQKSKQANEVKQSLQFFITQKSESLKSLNKQVVWRINELELERSRFNDQKQRNIEKLSKTTSQKRKERLQNKVQKIDDVILIINNKLQNIRERLNLLLQQENEKIEERQIQLNEVVSIIEQLQKEYQNVVGQVCALQNAVSISKDQNFIPLTDLCGMKYEKIIGCYIIRNRENNKVYVGQSKDVMRRLHQHFNGTMPNNIIFAEDYYRSEDRENLFEVMIIPCEGKDALDRKERELIEQYDAFETGYNRTQGNT